jgi:hypothetical protein
LGVSFSFFISLFLLFLLFRMRSLSWSHVMVLALVTSFYIYSPDSSGQPRRRYFHAIPG